MSSQPNYKSHEKPQKTKPTDTYNQRGGAQTPTYRKPISPPKPKSSSK